MMLANMSRYFAVSNRSLHLTKNNSIAQAIHQTELVNVWFIALATFFAGVFYFWAYYFWGSGGRVLIGD